MKVLAYALLSPGAKVILSSSSELEGIGVYPPPAFESPLGGADTNSPRKCEWLWLLWLCAKSVMEDSFFIAGKSVYFEAEHTYNLLADYMPVLLRAYHSGYGVGVPLTTHNSHLLLDFPSISQSSILGPISHAR